MAFKMITLSEKEVVRLAGNAKAHAETIARKLTARWRRALAKGQEYLDVYQLQMCLSRELRKLRRDINVIERKHLSELETDRVSRIVRDQTIPQLRGQLIGIKSVFDGSFGPGASIKVFGRSNLVIPVDPFPLRRIAFHVHDNLMAPDLVLPPLQVAGVTVTPRQLAKGFRPHLTQLDEVLVRIEDTLPITNATLERKIVKLRQMRKRAGVAGRFLEALYDLAEHEELARRVRPSTHRARRQETENGSGASAPDDSGAAPGAATPGASTPDGEAVTDADVAALPVASAEEPESDAIAAASRAAEAGDGEEDQVAKAA